MNPQSGERTLTTRFSAENAGTVAITLPDLDDTQLFALILEMCVVQCCMHRLDQSVDARNLYY